MSIRASFTTRGVALTVVACGIGLVAACLPNPEGDFNEFKAKAASQAGTSGDVIDSGPPSEASAIDTRPPDVAQKQLYVAICVTALAAGDPEQALRFYVESEYTPDASGATNGSIAMTLSPMVGWDVPKNLYVQPVTVGRVEIRGNAIPVPATPIAPDGHFTLLLNTIELPAEANSISGRAATIANTTLNGLYGNSGRFCSTLAGDLTKPYASKFDPKQNTCIFEKATEGDPLPKIPAADFVCAVPQ